MRKVQNSLPALGAAKQSASAAVVRLTLLTQRCRATHRADARHSEWGGVALALVQQHRHHFRNHVARAAHDDRVAQAHVFASGLVFIVQGGVGHRDPTDKHRGQLGDRSEFAGTAHLHIDGQHSGELLLCRVFVGHGPARLAGDKAKPLLQRKAVDLVNHPVNIKWQLVPRSTDTLVVRY